MSKFTISLATTEKLQELTGSDFKPADVDAEPYVDFRIFNDGHEILHIKSAKAFTFMPTSLNEFIKLLDAAQEEPGVVRMQYEREIMRAIIHQGRNPNLTKDTVLDALAGVLA